jgi:hypothetical protein
MKLNRRYLALEKHNSDRIYIFIQLKYIVGARAKQAKTIFTIQHCMDNLDKRYDDDLINLTGYLDGF